MEEKEKNYLIYPQKKICLKYQEPLAAPSSLGGLDIEIEGEVPLKVDSSMSALSETGELKEDIEELQELKQLEKLII